MTDIEKITPYEASILLSLRLERDRLLLELGKAQEKLGVALLLIGERWGIHEGDHIADDGTVTRKTIGDGAPEVANDAASK